MSHLRRLLAPAHARPRKAALLLVVAAFLVLASPVHQALEAVAVLGGESAHGAEAEAHEALHAAAQAGSRLEAACPGDCEAHGHHHRGHDHGSCTSCRAFSAAGLHAAPAFSEAPTASRLAAAVAPSRPKERSLSPDAPRGPPATAPAVA